MTTITGTGLDTIVNIILDDPALNSYLPTSEIVAGASAAGGMNAIVVEAIQATGVANDGTLNAADARELNTYIQANHYDQWVELHGDDEGGEETGFHLVQGDGATTQLFGLNAVNTVADGLYHMGFNATWSQFENEDGAKNAKVADVAYWLSELLEDDLASGALSNDSVDLDVEGTTGTGLDQLVSIIVEDPGLNLRISTSEIVAGARAADAMNAIIVEAIQATSVANDGDINAADARDLNTYIQANHYDQWVELHGNDTGGQETGFNLVDGWEDGATTQLFGLNAVDAVADGIYHMGFNATWSQFENEDGIGWYSIEDTAGWLDKLLEDDLASGNLANPNADFV